MKCVLMSKNVVRVSNEVAHDLVAKGLAQYSNKTEWKKSGRKYL